MTIIRMPKPKYLDCDECINGHAPECDDLRPEDLYDCLWKLCTGCCPNGCPERGLELLASREGAKLRAMLQTDTEMAQHVNDDSPWDGMGRDPEDDDPEINSWSILNKPR